MILEIAILSLCLGLAWGAIALRKTWRTDRPRAWRDFARMALGGGVLLYAAIDWVRMILKPWL